MDNIMEWLPQLYGKDVGTGSGYHRNHNEIVRTGKVLTGYELLEACSDMLGGKEFSLQIWSGILVSEVQQEMIIMDELPTPKNQSGRLHYNTSHPENIYGSPADRSNTLKGVVEGGLAGHGR
jgi:hypothetical protein